MKKFFLFSIMAISFSLSTYAQSISINNDASAPHASAMLDVKSADKGLLIPRVALTGTADNTTIAAPATSLLVYNTATNGTGSTSVKPGYYYWSGTTWLMLSTVSGTATSWLLTGNTGTDTSVNFLGTRDNKSLRFKVNNTRSGYIGVQANDGNVFWGYKGGFNNRGHSNVALGIGALFSNTYNSNIVAIGDSALFNNMPSILVPDLGIQNTAVGSKALYSNTWGSSNTAIGNHALNANTFGNNNTAGGFNALYNNTEGSNNTANGYQALYGNQRGDYNTAMGAQALAWNQTGAGNTATGFNALFQNISGLVNTANGSYALYYNSDGTSNTAVGGSALVSNVSGTSNTAIGANALGVNYTGNYNTAIGDSALTTNVTGSYNTAIGRGADVVYTGTTGLTNATALGSGAMVDASNKVRLGNTSVTVIEGQVAYSLPSDARFKYNIQNNVPGLSFIKKLVPVTYYFDEEKLAVYTKTGMLNNSVIKPASYNVERQLHTGFLAQDVEKIASQLGYHFDGIHAPANDKDHYSLAYTQFIMPLVKSVQEQQQVIEDQSKKIDGQAEQITKLNNKIEGLAKIVERLTQK